MNFTYSFVEYLVNGVVSLLWVGLLLLSAAPSLHGHLDLVTLPALLPLCYIAGMVVDMLSLFLFRPLKKMARNELPSFLEEEKTLSWETGLSVRSAISFTALHAPELHKELQVRLSRDRIARGASFNAVMMLLVLLLPGPSEILESLGIEMTLVSWCSLSALAILLTIMWYIFERRTRRFKHEAIMDILEHIRTRVSDLA